MCPSAVLDADITSPSAERDLLMNCDSFNLFTININLSHTFTSSQIDHP
jgi:hypothetical protein